MNKKTYVNKNKCIGCGACVSIDETGTFFIGEDGLAETKENNLELFECQAICPTDAICIKKK